VKNLKFKEKIKNNIKNNLKDTLFLFTPWKWKKKDLVEIIKMVILIYISMFAGIALFCQAQDSILALPEDQGFNILKAFNPFCQKCVPRHCFDSMVICNEYGIKINTIGDIFGTART